MRVLVVVAKDEVELLRARKHLGYDRLVVVVPQAPPEALRAAAGPAAQLVEVPPYELLPCLERIQALLQGFRPDRDEVRVAVDGGTSAMSQAAFLACLSQGTEAWFLLHKVVRLPVLEARPVRQRFTEAELAVLAALDAPMSHEELAARAGLDLERMRGALLRLRKEDAVKADATTAQPTELGHYYRRSLAVSPHAATLR